MYISSFHSQTYVLLNTEVQWGEMVSNQAILSIRPQKTGEDVLSKEPRNASKECFWSKKFLNFMHGFKSAILAIFHFSGISTKRGFSLMSNDENKFQPIFQIQHIKSA